MGYTPTIYLPRNERNKARQSPATKNVGGNAKPTNNALRKNGWLSGFRFDDRIPHTNNGVAGREKTMAEPTNNGKVPANDCSIGRTRNRIRLPRNKRTTVDEAARNNLSLLI